MKPLIDFSANTYNFINFEALHSQNIRTVYKKNSVRTENIR